MKPPRTAAEARCRWCGTRLSDLERRSTDTCTATACRYKSGELRLRAEREASLERVLAEGDGRPPGARTVWLQDHDDALAPASAAEADALLAHLRDCAAEGSARERDPQIAGFEDDIGPARDVDRAVCSACRGRCCRAGLGRHAFIDAELLLRHRRLAGRSADEAVADYAARLPAEHVAGSCLYHGLQGCTLPREMRAPVCNGWVCDSLQHAREGDAKGEPLVMAVFAWNTVRRVATRPGRAEGSS